MLSPVADRLVADELPAAKMAGWGRRLWVRFALVYWVLFYYPFPLDIVPGTDNWTAAIDKPLDLLAVFVGRHLLGLHTVPISSAGGDAAMAGDRLSAYLRLLCTTALAALIAWAWAALDRRRVREDAIARGLRLYLRYALAGLALSYGIAKLIPPLQFALPGPTRLSETYGESSPFALLWTFMGTSPFYAHFAGVAEVVGAVLLFFRRSVYAGALLLMPVLANVVLLNFCYDVPVKLLSLHMLVSAAVLLRPAAGKLLRALVPPRDGASGRMRAVLHAAACFALLAGVVLGQFRARREVPQPSPIDGLYRFSPGAPWLALAVESNQFVVRDTTGARVSFTVKFDPAQSTATVHDSEDHEAGVLRYEQTRPDELTLTGKWQGAPLTVRARKQGAPLLERGFRWTFDPA
jgi:hypothetical protein